MLSKIIASSALVAIVSGQQNSLSFDGVGAATWSTIQWQGGTLPTSVPVPTTAVTITGNTQVDVDQSIEVFSLALGAAATAGTELVVGSAFKCAAFIWNNGKMTMTAASEFEFTAQVAVKAGGAAEIEGGTILMSHLVANTGVRGWIELEADASFKVSSAVVAGGEFLCQAGSVLELAVNNTITAATTIKGAGEARVSGAFQASAAVAFESQCTLEANAQVAVATTFDAAAMAWTSAEMWMEAAAAFTASGAVTVNSTGSSSVSSVSSVHGGTFGLDASASLAVEAGATFDVEGVIVAGGAWAAETGSWLMIRGQSSTKAATSTTIMGGGELHISDSFSVNGNFQADVDTYVAASTEVAVAAVFQASAMTINNTKFVLGASGELKTSGTITVTSSSGSNGGSSDDESKPSSCEGGTLDMSGSATAAISVEANAHLVLKSIMVKGGEIRTATNSKVRAAAGVVFESATTVKGEGSLAVEGSLEVQASFQAECTTTVEAGASLIIAAGSDAKFAAIACADSTSKIVLNAAADAFTTVEASGEVTLNGNLELDLSGYASRPTSKITLMTTAGADASASAKITGTFSSISLSADWASSASISGRRLLAEEDGSVTYDENNVYYEPPAGGSKASPASQLVVSLGLVTLLSSVAHLFSS